MAQSTLPHSAASLDTSYATLCARLSLLPRVRAVWCVWKPLDTRGLDSFHHDLFFQPTPPKCHSVFSNPAVSLLNLRAPAPYLKEMMTASKNGCSVLEGATLPRKPDKCQGCTHRLCQENKTTVMAVAILHGKHTRHVFGFALATPGYNVRPVLSDLFLATNHTMSSFGTRWQAAHMKATV